jgi:hypothetical protein
MFCPVLCSSEASTVCSCSERCLYRFLNFIIGSEARAMLACQEFASVGICANEICSCASALLPFLRMPVLQLTNMCLPI